MWSVYASASHVRRAALPEALRPMRLSRALDVVLEDWDEHDGPRRRRVLSELTAAGLVHPRTGLEIAERVVRLTGDPGVGRRLLESERRAALGALNETLEQAPPPDQCIALQDVRLEPQYDPRTRATTVTASARVNRPLRELAPFIDPQCWDNVGEFFADCYVIDKQTYRRIDAWEPGTSWTGYLYECFEVPVARFENVLRIDFSVKAAEIRADYELYDSPRFTFAGFERPGVLEVDDGFISAKGAPAGSDWSEMNMRKTVVFADLTPGDTGGPIDHGQWLNMTAVAMLSGWLGDAGMACMCYKGARDG
jgi:hypothetical protein